MIDTFNIHSKFYVKRFFSYGREDHQEVSGSWGETLENVGFLPQQNYFISVFGYLCNRSNKGLIPSVEFI